MEFIEKKRSNEAQKVIAATQRIGGVFADAIQFIENEQLLDRTLWKKFVAQFREQPDAPTNSILSLHFQDESGERFRLTDYASVGKDWKSMIAAWLPTK